jgi:two-component system, OmpR family, response regulator PrrA
MNVLRDAGGVPHVLVVDDAPEIRKLFSAFLSRSGMRVVQADGGHAALVAVRGVTPDLVVTDLAMPEMGGIELCRWFRANPATRDVPIVVVSGDAAAEGTAAWEAGCDAVLGKPCSGAVLVATVARLLTMGRWMDGRPASADAPAASDFDDLIRMDSDKG